MTTQSTTTHTPGPWSVRTVGGELRIFESHGISLAMVYNDDSAPAGEDNARLIAAAPQLLAALIIAKASGNASS